MFGLVRAVRAISRTRTSRVLPLQNQVGTQAFGEVIKQAVQDRFNGYGVYIIYIMLVAGYPQFVALYFYVKQRALIQVGLGDSYSTRRFLDGKGDVALPLLLKDRVKPFLQMRKKLAGTNRFMQGDDLHGCGCFLYLQSPVIIVSRALLFKRAKQEFC
jgi:hypothetical protein